MRRRVVFAGRAAGAKAVAMTWTILNRRAVCRGLGVAGELWAIPHPAQAAVITRMPTNDPVVALTFDACEARAPAHLDWRIAQPLIASRTPFTVFMSGRFARDNAADAASLARHDFISIQNHSMNHINDMPRLSDARVRAEVLDAAEEIQRVTGRKTRLFRFPAGVCDARTIAIVESLGYRVVHWAWPEGDPDPRVSASAMIGQTLTRTQSGEVLIFHINGRGVHTADAVPAITAGLKQRGFRFVKLTDYL